MRRRLYFHNDAGPYQAGHWYDNVPDAQFKKCTTGGVAESVYAAECRCLVTYEGAVVRDGGPPERPCPFHAKAKRAKLAAPDEPAQAPKRTTP